MIAIAAAWVRRSRDRRRDNSGASRSTMRGCRSDPFTHRIPRHEHRRDARAQKLGWTARARPATQLVSPTLFANVRTSFEHSKWATTRGSDNRLPRRCYGIAAMVDSRPWVTAAPPEIGALGH